MHIVNGISTKTISADDRGLMYGDGFFSTLKVRHNKVEHWALHVDRIQFSAEKLQFPVVDISKIEEELETLIGAQSSTNGVIRLTITRGSGQRGYKPSNLSSPSTILSWSETSEALLADLSHGVELTVCSVNESSNPALAGVKHLNRLPQVLASSQIPDDCFDGIMLADQHIIGGSKTNIYFYREGGWQTPSVTRAGVDGTVRRWLLAAQKNVKEASLGLEILHDAQYCMVSNALYGMIPVTKILQHRYDISPEIANFQQQYRDSALIE